MLEGSFFLKKRFVEYFPNKKVINDPSDKPNKHNKKAIWIENMYPQNKQDNTNVGIQKAVENIMKSSMINKLRKKLYKTIFSKKLI